MGTLNFLTHNLKFSLDNSGTCVCVCVCVFNVYARLDGCIQYKQPPLLPGIVLVVVLAITSVAAAVGRLVLFTGVCGV